MDPPRAPKDAPKGAPEGAQWTPRLLHFYHRPTPFPHLQPIYQNPPQVPYARTGAPFGGSWSVRGTLLKTMTPVDLPIYDDISCKRWPSNPLWPFLEVPSDKRLPPVKVYVRTRCISRPPRRFVFFHEARTRRHGPDLMSKMQMAGRPRIFRHRRAKKTQKSEVSQNGHRSWR